MCCGRLVLIRLFFGFVVALFTFSLNYYIEIKKIDSSVTTKYAQAYLDNCKEVWMQITDIEIESENLVSDVRFNTVFKKNKHDIYSDLEITNKINELSNMRENAAKYIRENEPVLGKDLVHHFLKYVGLQSNLFDAEIESERNMNSSQPEYRQEFIKKVRNDLNKMRFGIEEAKTIALKKYMR